MLDLVAWLRWAFLVLEVSPIMFSSPLLSESRLVHIRYEHVPSQYVEVLRTILNKTILQILLGLAVLGL